MQSTKGAQRTSCHAFFEIISGALLSVFMSLTSRLPSRAYIYIHAQRDRIRAESERPFAGGTTDTLRIVPTIQLLQVKKAT